MTTHPAPFRPFLAFLLAASLLGACSPAAPTAPDPADDAAAGAVTTPPVAVSKGKIAVGSKNFTEAFIVGEIYAQALERAGYEVERKLNLGATDIAQAALVAGDIDLYPEYTSTGLMTVLKAAPLTDEAAIYQAVKAGYQEQFNLVWLDPAPFNNPQALATTKTVAETHKLATYSDLAAAAPELVLGAPPEFIEREDGLPGLQKAYGGFAFKEVRQLDAGLRYPALESGDVDVVVAFGTDGQISGFGLQLLQDDKKLYPPYQVAPVLRQAVLDAHPDIAETLNGISRLLSTEKMQAMNWSVDGPDKREPAEVAQAFLVEAGILTP